MRTPMVFVSVQKCQRCGKDHPGLGFLQLANPVDDYMWWANCPYNGHPILLKKEADPPATEDKKTPLPVWKIVDGYCVNEIGMRVGKVSQAMIPFQKGLFIEFRPSNFMEVMFFDFRYFQNAGQCCLRLTGDPVATIELP